MISHVWSYWQSGGLLLIPLAVVSFMILLFVLRTQWTARSLLRDGRILRAWLGKHRGNYAVSSLRQDLPFNTFSAVFHGALRQIEESHISPREAIEQQESDAMQYLRRDFLFLSALTASAPLLGLLGTVGGMIATFDAVSQVTGQTGTRVAGGVSRALITTQFGLVVAMPGVFGLAYTRQLTRDIQLLLGDCRAHIVAMLVSRTRGNAEGGGL